MHRPNNISYAVLAMGIVSLLLPATLFAQGVQERTRITISPTLIEEKIEPGTEHDYIITVKNDGTSPMTLYPFARNITGVDEEEEYRLIYATEKGDEDFELASWITYREKVLELGVGEAKALHFTVRFPRDAHPGSHMGGVFLADKPSNEVRNGTGVGFEIATNMNFQIAGEIIEKTLIREFFPGKTFYSEPKVDLTLRVENLGNILTRPRGIIDITNMWGKRVASLPVNENGSGVYPNSTRTFDELWKPEGLEIGRYEATVVLLIEGSEGDQALSSVIEFWIMPMNVVLSILGGLLVFVIVAYVLIKLYVRKQLAGVRLSRGSSRGGLSRLTAVVIALLVAIIVGLLTLFIFFG